jgi:hypothetical protein
MLWLFRRLNTCRHNFGCVESIFRRLYRWVTGYLLIRLPIYALLAMTLYKNHPEGYHLMNTRGFITAECIGVGVSGVVSAGVGCLVRYLHEEVVEVNGGVGPRQLSQTGQRRYSE